MANTALSHQQSEAHEQEQAHPLRLDREGFALLRARLRAANADNPQFDLQHKRLVELLKSALRRLESEFGEQIELVVAEGDWTRYGIDLRNLPFDDVVLLIVVRGSERPFSLYWDIADRVFVKLNDRDVFLQFGLETREEWDAGSAVARQRGVSEALGIPLLTRSN
jgi:hypothetical protein